MLYVGSGSVSMRPQYNRQHSENKNNLLIFYVREALGAELQMHLID